MSKDTNKNLEIQKKQEKFGGKEYIYQGHKTGLREFDVHFDACRCNKCNNKALISVFNNFSGDRTHWCPICKAEEFIENTNIVERANKEDKKQFLCRLVQILSAIFL